MRIVVVRGPEMFGPFELVPGPNIVGRDPGCAIRLISRRVSRKHAVAFLSESRLKVSDLGSANGLFDEAGHRADTVLLTPGRRVQIGDFVLRFESDEVTTSLDLDDDDPLTADDDLLLEDMDEETPARHGPVPVLRQPEPKSQRTPRPVTTVRQADPPTTPAPLAALPPLPAKHARPIPVVTPDPGRLTVEPSLSLIGDHPTAETSARIARPVLPFGPPSGGFGGFMPAGPAPKPDAAPPQLSPFASPSTTGERPKAAPPPPPTALPPVAPPAREHREPLRDELTPLSNPSLPLLMLDPSRSDVTPLKPPPFAKEDPPTVSDAGPQPPRPARAASGAWIAQAMGVLMLAASLVMCGPFGGLFALIYGGHQDAISLSLLRGETLAESLGNRNAAAVAQGRGIALETSFLLEQAGVREAMIADASGTVIAPPERLRTTIAKTAAYAQASDAHDVVAVESDSGTYEIVAPIRGEVAAGSGARTIVGWSWIRYDPASAAASVSSPWIHVLAALFFLAAAGAVLVFGGYWLFVRPLQSLREETELAVTGSVEKVVPSVRFGPLDDVAHSINRAIERGRR